MKKTADIEPRNAPVQGRSKKRSKQIIDATSELLERVGFDDLNTILIAKETGISIGSLYHYFPNKHAILYAMGMRWLDDIESVLKEFDGWDIENIPLSDLIDDMLSTNFKVYKKQKAILTLVQAMFSVPELRELDEKHDEMMITTFARLFKRMGMSKQLKERERLGRVYLESTHAVFVTMSTQQGERVKRTQADLKVMVMALLLSHLVVKNEHDT
ncbi:MAG: AcrR family transcriptional regulator [Crocinitomicaceae bacterium]